MLRIITRAAAGGSGFAGRGVRLLLAAVLAVIAGLFVYATLSQQEQTAIPDAAGATKVPVVVAKRDIPAGTALTPDMLDLTHLPEETVLPEAFRTVDTLIGQFARFPIYAGEQLLRGKLAAAGVDVHALSLTVPHGMRALAVRVDKVIGAGGLLRPGDRVDVLAVLQQSPATAGSGAAGTPRAFTIAENVQVLAVEQELVNAPPASGGADGQRGADGTLIEQPDPQPKGTVATLAVTLAQAEQIFLADEEGALRLAVRPPDDLSTAPRSTSTAEAPDHPATPIVPAPALNLIVPPGLRALGVGINKVIGAGGLLHPGDRVDVVAVLQVERFDGAVGAVVASARAITIAQNIEVLAVEQTLRTPDAAAEGGTANDQPLATVVTLAVLPLQAQQIVLAEAEGIVRLAVRARGDEDIVGLEDSTSFSLTDAGG